MFCSHCGAKLADSSKFCPFCGNAAQPPVQPAAPVYSAPVYSYPVYVMPSPAAQPVSQPTVQAAPTAPVSTTGNIPAYRRPMPTTGPVFPAASVAPAASAASVAPVAPAAPAAFAASAEEATDIVPEPVVEDTSAPLTVWQTIVCLLALFCLPVGNIIFATVWGFRLNEHPQRRTLARAALPFIAVGLLVLFGGLLWLVLNMHTISITLH